MFSSEGKFRKSFGVKGEAQGQFNEPSGVAVDANGFALVGDRSNNRVQLYILISKFCALIYCMQNESISE